MIVTLALLAAQLAVAAPDTSLFAAFVMAVDTAAAPGHKPSLRGRTMHADLAAFARRADVPPPANVALPAHWRPYREEDLGTCLASPECGGLDRAFVRTARVERQPDGSLVIFGTIHYLIPVPPRPPSLRGIAGAGGGAVRLFHARLRIEAGAWKVTSLGVLHAA